MAGIEKRFPQGETHQTVFEHLLHLDQVFHPALQADVFRAMFAMCRRCQLVMTKRVFWVHDCQGDGGIKGEEVELIDLTEED
jgi:hypothetical protein